MDEEKYHKLDPKKKPLYLAAGAFFILVVLPALSYFYCDVALNRPAQGEKEKVFRIGKGEDVLSISSRLYDEELINSKALFSIYVVTSGNQAKIQAGVYTVPAGSNVKQLVTLFAKGTDDARITFLEGWRVEEIAQEASKKFENVGYDSFVEKAKKYEGGLFPDTYDFNANADEETIINAMRENFTARTADVLTDSALAQAGLSKDRALIVASIVEREVSADGDRKIVAGILLKRLKEGMFLDADATVQYAVAPGGDGSWWIKKLTAEDLESPSPYNTRKIVGLPPTPICNPGLSSIKAVLELQETKYYYYLTDDDGTVHYAQTLDEHNKNIAKYL